MVAHLLFWGDFMKIFGSKKNLAVFILVAICFVFNNLTSLFTASTLLGFINYLLSLSPTAIILCYLLLENKDFKFKKYMFPVAFGIHAFRNIYTIVASIPSALIYLRFQSQYINLFGFTVVLCLFNVLCFVGTLCKFKNFFLLKFGCLGYITAALAMQLYEFISLGGMDYINSVPSYYWSASILALIRLISLLLFYVGIFIYSTNKKPTNTAQ